MRGQRSWASSCGILGASEGSCPVYPSLKSSLCGHGLHLLAGGVTRVRGEPYLVSELILGSAGYLVAEEVGCPAFAWDFSDLFHESVTSAPVSLNYHGL